MAAIDSQKARAGSDSTAASDTVAKAQLAPHVDRLALLSDPHGRPNTLPGAEPPEINFDSAFKGASTPSTFPVLRSAGLLRGIGAANDPSLPLPTQPTESTDPDCATHVMRGLSMADPNCLNVAGQKLLSTNLKPGAHTVAVLDDFAYPAFASDHDSGRLLSHGEVIARAAESDGYGVLRMNWNHVFTSMTLPQVADAVENGSLPLKSGDFINMSFGTGNESFEHLNKGLNLTDAQGKPITIDPSNLAQHKAAILEAWKKAGDSSVDSYNAIQRLSKLGITLMNAAGNEGPNVFDPDYLGSKYSMRALDPNGKVMPFSSGYVDGNNAGLGQYQLRYVDGNKDAAAHYEVVGDGKVYGSYSPAEVGGKVPESWEDWQWSYDGSKDNHFVKNLTDAGAAAADATFGDSHTPPNRRFAPPLTTHGVEPIVGSSFVNLEKLRELSQEEIKP